MTSLVMRDGKLLIVGGALTTNENCCCDDECPTCCVKINFGTFDEFGDLVDTYDIGGGVTIEVKVEMPTPNSRIVCDTESVTVSWDYFEDGVPGATATGGYARFGAAWELGGVSPAIAAPGGTNVWGIADWGSAAEEEGHSVTLSFRKCFLDATPFLAYITIGFDVPEWSLDIDITGCPLPDWCCREDPVCEPCCAVLDMANWVEFDGKLHYVADSADVNGNRFTIIGILETDARGKVCIDGGLSLELFLIPPRIEDTPDNNMVVNFAVPWEVADITPAIAGDGEQTLSKVDWGTLDDQYYKISLQLNCVDNCTESPVDAVIPDISAINSVFGTVAVNLDDCDMTDCCCPTWCVCGCEWPFSFDFCADALEDGLFGKYEVGGATEMIDFEIEITASSPVFCGGTKSVVKIEQAAQSWHLATCVDDCPRTNGLLFDVFDESQHCGTPGSAAGRVRVQLSDANDCVPGISVALDFAMEGGVPFSAETIPIDAGGLDGCGSINASGTRVIEGVTYNYTITGTIQGARDCPCE